MVEKVQWDAYTVGTRFWHALADGRVQCDLCPRHCRMQPGQRGACFVRANLDSQVVLTTYGRSSGFCIDPIEKKPLNHFLPGSAVLSFGTAGCNLACRFCQNWDISKARDIHILGQKAEPEQIAVTAKGMNCQAVAFTYNDPVIFLEFATEVAEACHERGIRTVAVTAGYITEAARAAFFDNMDAANVDIKAFSERFYHRLTGASLEPVLETIDWLVNETPVWVEITNLLIPGENDSEAEIHALCEWVMERLGPAVPLHFTAFHPDYRMLDHPPTPPESLQWARRAALETGLQHVYTGNIHDPDGQSTCCHTCGNLLIGRSGYRLSHWDLTEEGTCRSCGTPLAGLFEPEPGGWDGRCVPVRLGWLAES